MLDDRCGRPAGLGGLQESGATLLGAAVLVHARTEEKQVTAPLMKEVLCDRDTNLVMVEADGGIDLCTAQLPYLDDRDGDIGKEAPGRRAVGQAGQDDRGRRPKRSTTLVRCARQPGLPGP